MSTLTVAARVLARVAALAMPAPATEAKASRTGPLIAYDTLGAPAWSGRDYASFAREGYMQNAVVHRCVRMIAESAASVPLILYDRRRELEDHPLLDLLARPAPNTTRADFLAAVYGSLLVSGNAYVELVTVGDTPRELHLLRPDRIRIIPGPSGWPAAFEYTASGGSVRFDAEPRDGIPSPILHLKLYHPLDDHYGLSPVEAAATAIDIHNQASRWNKALLDNAARPSGALVYAAREGRLSPEQFERLKSELQEGFQGAKNAGRPLLLEGGLDWKPLSLSPKDMDFIETKNAAAREIALALGIPPMLLGIPGDNTYSNFQEATRALWRQTVLPLVDRTAAAVSAWLAPAYPETLRLVTDLDQIPALAPEREALWAQLEAASFLTTDEKRAAVGYMPLDRQASVKNGKVAPRPFDPRPFEAAPPGRDTPATKYSPDQPRDELGRWTDAGGGDGTEDGSDTDDVTADTFDELIDDFTDELFGGDGNDGDGEGGIIDAQARRGQRTPVTVNGRTMLVSPQMAREIEAAQARAANARAMVRERDPEWSPTPSIFDPAGPSGVLSHYRNQAQEAEARLQVLERGSLPLGFNSHEQFREFGQTASNAFRRAGYTDAATYLRGSAVTGHRYTSGRPFGEQSDLDLAIVSPSLLQRANDIGVAMRQGGGRTAELTPIEIQRLGLQQFVDRTSLAAGRNTTIMIYRSADDIAIRGPYVPVQD